MKNKKNMRLISCVLLLCMLFTLMPVAALAETTEGTETVESTETTESTTELFDGVVDTDNATGSQYQSAGTGSTAGQKAKAVKATRDAVTLPEPNADGKFEVTTGSALNYTSMTDAVTVAAAYEGTATIKMLDGAATVTSTVTIPEGADIILDLNGQKIEVSGNNNYGILNKGTLTVKDSTTDADGTVKSGYGIKNEGTLTVESGILIGTVHDGIWNSENAGNIIINGGTIQGLNLAICDYAEDSYNEVNGGTLDCNGTGTSSGCGYVVGSYHTNKGGTWKFTGDAVMKNAAGKNRWVDTTRVKIDNENSTTAIIADDVKNGTAYNAKVVVASGLSTELSNNKYKNKAVTVTLYADVSNSVVTIPKGANVTLDLNGHKISAPIDHEAIINNGTLTVKDSKGTGIIQGKNGITNHHVLTVNGGNIIGVPWTGIYNEEDGDADTVNKVTIGDVNSKQQVVIKGQTIAICDSVAAGENTVVNAHLVCTGTSTAGTNSAGGFGYVLGGHMYTGGTWTIGKNVTVESAYSNDHWINTNDSENANTPVTVKAKYNNLVRLYSAVVVAKDKMTEENTYTGTIVSTYGLANELFMNRTEPTTVTFYGDRENDLGTLYIKGYTTTLDLNGYTFGSYTSAIQNQKGSTLTIKNGTVIAGSNGAVHNEGTLTTENANLGGEKSQWGIYNLGAAGNITIKGGTIQGQWAAIVDFNKTGVNAITGGATLKCPGTNGYNGYGYVIGSYGASTGGLWSIANDVTIINDKNPEKRINTDENGRATKSSQISIVDYQNLEFDATGKVVSGGTDPSASAAAEEILKASKASALLAVQEKANEAINAGVDRSVVAEILEAAKTAINNADTKEKAAAAANIAVAKLDVLIKAQEAIAAGVDEAAVKAIVDSVINADDAEVVTKANEALANLETKITEAKTNNLEPAEQDEITKIKNDPDLSDAVKDAKVQNILDKADLIDEINNIQGLSDAKKADFTAKVEAVKTEAQDKLDKDTTDEELELIVAKADAKYEAIRLTANVYPTVTAAGKAELDKALETALAAIGAAQDTMAIDAAMEALRAAISDIRANYTPDNSYSGTYNYVVKPQTSNGKVNVSDSSAAAGETVTITTAPDKGYGVSEVVVTDKNGKVIEVTALGNGQYTFVMPAGGVDVQVVTKPAITLWVGETKANVFGKTVENDVAPMIKANRTMLPIRFVAEALGAEVGWNAQQQKVTITNDDTVIELYIGKTVAYVDGEAVQLDTAPFIKDDRTYLPVRFVSEYLGAAVNWYADTKAVTIVPAE